MAEGVGANRFMDAGFGGEVLNDVKNHHAAQPGTSAIEEKNVFVFGGNGGKMSPDRIQVNFNVFYGGIANGNQTLFVVFAYYP